VLELLEGIFFQYFGCNQGCEIELNKTKLWFHWFCFGVKWTSLNYHLRLRKSSMINTLDKNGSSKIALK
jgi:hypothetical protein